MTSSISSLSPISSDFEKDYPFPATEEVVLARVDEEAEYDVYDSLKHRLRGTAFSTRDGSVNVHVTDVFTSIQDSPYCYNQQTFEHESTLCKYFESSAVPYSRTIQISAKNSISPLPITQSCLERTISHHDLSQSIWDVIASFRSKPGNADAGFGSMIVKQSSNGSFDMQYTMVYAEETQTPTSTSWTLRQVGVINSFVPPTTYSQTNALDTAGDSNILIILHPKKNSPLQKRIAQQHIKSKTPIQPFFTAHLLILSTYFPAWRFYLSHLNSEMETIADIALTLQFSHSSHYAEGYTQLRKLKHLEDKVLPLTARFQTTLGTIQKLLEMNEMFVDNRWCGRDEWRELSDELKAYETYCQGHLITVALLQKRVSEILSLLSIALSLKNQDTSVEINGHMLALTKDTVDDSATVRVVTLVTLIYLPASFVCSFLGMNLFTFGSDPNNAGFQISKKFWIFFLLTIPLTTLTVGIWFVISRRRKKLQAAQKERGIDEEKQL